MAKVLARAAEEEDRFPPLAHAIKLADRQVLLLEQVAHRDGAYSVVQLHGFLAVPAERKLDRRLSERSSIRIEGTGIPTRGAP